MNVSDLSDIDERILMDGKVNFAKAATSEAAPVAEHHEQRDNDAVAPIPATTPTEPQSSAQHEDNNGSKTGHRPPKRFCRRSPEPGPTTTDSNPSPESPELNNANNAISTEANIEYKPAPTETPTDSCGDGKPPVKDRPRRNRRSPKRDAEDTFRVNMGMLPHSRSTETVTDDMREMLRQGFDMLDPVHRVEFGQCLHSSIPDSARRYLRWEGFGQAVISFEKLPKTAVHDLTLFLKVYGVVEDKDGEGKRVLELLKRKQASEA